MQTVIPGHDTSFHAFLGCLPSTSSCMRQSWLGLHCHGPWSFHVVSIFVDKVRVPKFIDSPSSRWITVIHILLESLLDVPWVIQASSEIQDPVPIWKWTIFAGCLWGQHLFIWNPCNKSWHPNVCLKSLDMTHHVSSLKNTKDMTKHQGHRAPEDGARNAVFCVLVEPDGFTGLGH